MRYLVAVDGSASAERAFEYALNLVKDKNRDVVIILCMVEQYGPELFDEDLIVFVTEAMKQENELLKKKAEQIVLELGERCKKLGIQCETAVREGSARDGILEAIREFSADMIVVGSRGLGMIKRMLLGSVSEYVVRNAPVPVLVVKEPEK